MHLILECLLSTMPPILKRSIEQWHSRAKSAHLSPRARDGKTYERASNAGVKISSSGRDFTVCWVLLFIDHIIVVSIDVWQSYFAHIFCKYILRCVANSLLSQFTHFLGKVVLAQTLLMSKNCLFPCLPRADTRLLWSGVYSGCSVQCAVCSGKTLHSLGKALNTSLGHKQLSSPTG